MINPHTLKCILQIADKNYLKPDTLNSYEM